MGVLTKLYNKKSLEKEINDFYTGVQSSSLDYVKAILMDSVDEEKMTIQDNSLIIKEKGEDVLHKLETAVYSIPGKLLITEDEYKLLQIL